MCFDKLEEMMGCGGCLSPADLARFKALLSEAYVETKRLAEQAEAVDPGLQDFGDGSGAEEQWAWYEEEHKRRLRVLDEKEAVVARAVGVVSVGICGPFDGSCEGAVWCSALGQGELRRISV